MANVATQPANQGSCAHAHVRWHQPTPAKGKKYPGVMGLTCHQLVRALEAREGALWMRVRRSASVAGYAISRAYHRVRDLRRDGAESLLAMTVALIYLADLRSGFIGRPRAGGGPWHRYTIRDLAQLAYGAQTPAALRRARRAMDTMISLGWLFSAKQVRRYKGKNTFRSEPGVRRLNLRRLCIMTGTSWALKRDRKHAIEKYGPVVVSIEDARRKRQSAEQARALGHPAPGKHDRPPTTGDPPARALAMRQIGQLFPELNLKG